MYCRIGLLIGCLLYSIIAQGQYFLSSKHYGLASGIGHRHINTSFIDSHGRKIILSANDLAFFENGNFKTVSFPDSYSTKGLNTIYEDDLGNYWISESFEWFYPFGIRHTFVFLPNHQFIPAEQKLPYSINIESIRSDERRQLVIGTQQGEIYTYSAQKNRMVRKLKYSNAPIKVLYAQNNRIVFCEETDISLDKKIVVIDYAGKILYEESLSNRLCQSVLEVGHEFYALYLRYDAHQKKSMELVKLGTNTRMQGNINQTFFYLTGITYEPKHKTIVLYHNNKIQFLNENLQVKYEHNFANAIHHLLADGHGNLFLSTDNGFSIIRVQKGQIQTYLYNPNIEAVEENYSCRSILKIDKTHLVVNTNRSRQLLDLTTGKSVVLPPLRPEASVDFVLSILPDEQGNIWFGEQLLGSTNLKTRKNQIYYSNYETRIWAMENYQDGFLLGLEKKGIGHYHKATQRVDFRKKNIPKALQESTVYDFYKTKNQVYIASSSGLYVLDSLDKITEIEYPKEQKKATYFINTFVVGNPTRLCLATEEGILLLDTSTGQITPFIRDKAFANVKFLSCYATQNGYWASTEQGIWHFDNQGNLLKIYTELDGLTNNECNTLAHYQDEQGVLYFGGINGLNVINPVAFPSQHQEGNILLKKVAIFSNQALSQVQTQISTPRIFLKTNENTLKIEVAYNDYQYDCDKRFYYTTQANQLEWTPFLEEELRLENLPYGKTTVYVKVVACNNFSQSSIKSIEINREYPIYFRWYFWVLVGGGLALGVWGLVQLYAYNYRLRNLKLKALVDRQTVRLQENIQFRDDLLKLLVHDVRHPIISFNNLTDKLNLLIRRNEHERLLQLGAESKHRSESLLWLVDNLILWIQSSNKNETVVPQNVDLVVLINRIIRSYSNDIDFRRLTFVIEPAVFIGKVDERLFVIVMRNIIFNTIEYAKSGSSIQIRLSRNTHLLTIDCQNFMHSETEPQPELQGLKMGLSVLKAILKKQSIELTNEKVGEIYHTKLVIPE